MDVSIFRKYHLKENRKFIDVFNAIKDCTLGKQILDYRNQKEVDSKTAQQLKEALISFTPCASFNKTRSISNIESYNKIILLDFDHIFNNEEEVNIVTDLVNGDAYTYCSFISPSGDGFKVLTRVNSELEYHQSAYSQVAKYYETLIGQKADRSGKDVTRLCFISSDETAYLNENSAIYKVDIVKEGCETALVKVNRVQTLDHNIPLERALELTEQYSSFEIGNRNNFIHFFACICNRWGIPQYITLDFLLGSHLNYAESEIKPSVASAYKNVAEWNKYPLKLDSKATKNSSPEFADFAKNASFVKIDSTLIPSFVYENLPPLLKQGCDIFKDDLEKDVFLTAALGVLSGCLTNTYGVYANEIIYPNLFVFITAPAASGKGVLKYAECYGSELHTELLANQKVEFESTSAKRILFIPGNVSSSAIMGHLESNGGTGVFFETEADTLNNSLKQEWGSFSDMFRKAFHNEKVSLSRKQNNEYIEIEKPSLAIVLSGTPGQISGLIKSTEDGLFSRFIFYKFKSESKWKDVSPQTVGDNYTNFFKILSNEAYKQLKGILNHKKIDVILKDHQWQELNQVQDRCLKQSIELYGENASSLVKRMGTMWFKICMVLTVIRMANKLTYDNLQLICDDVDFRIAKELIGTYKTHIFSVYEDLPQEQSDELKGSQKLFFNALPNEIFSKAKALEVGKQISISNRSVGDYLNNLLKRHFLTQPKYGLYLKSN